MMKKLFAIALIAFAFAAGATGLTSQSVQDAGFENLTESQKASVLKTITDTQSDGLSDAAKASTPAKVNEWIDTGTKIGQMFGGAAKEVGVAVNEFVQTPVGKWTMAIIIWKYMGGAIIHLMAGAIIFVTGFSILYYLSRKCTTLTVVYDRERKDVFGRALKVSAVRSAINEDNMIAFFAGVVVVTFVSLLVTFTY
jgi:hypothetical protein